uniref:Uncharacterized protein n=1 Tax=Anguilla anguilla TaxID=7936 RepID=A0A0E9R4H7_ANGAN
MYGARTFVNS